MSMSDETLRKEVRSWLREHWNPQASLVEWRNVLVDSGWAMPQWPERWFGKDLDARQAAIVAAEMSAAGAVGVAASGPGRLAAAVLLEHGSDAQKERYLRRILTGEDLWCQLFSEPGSGSDLAGSTTRADFDGEQWIVNGQKVWNTSAHHARYGILVARTDWDVPKHQGLSFFVLDMKQPGVSVQQLKQMNGHASFNEVFFTDACIPADQMVSSPGNGWQVALTTLAHERRMGDVLRATATVRGSGRVHREAAEETAVLLAPYTWYPQRAGRVDLVLPRARATGAIRDPVIRQEIARLLTLEKVSQWTALRARAAQRRGKPQGPEGSLGKLAASNLARAAARVHTLISGESALLSGPESPESGVIAEILVSVPAISIAGGTDEIQRNIIAERVLGMDKEPRFDTGPFRDVRRN
ncbi:MAG: acyl-CoA dehydrogenase family protein [Pseudomonadales bacterium]|nr:acyl-CoA dehydrogenase family protein [Pseudomonadales bacterium]